MAISGVTIRKVTKPVVASTTTSKQWGKIVNPEDAETYLVKDNDNLWCCTICQHKQKHRYNVKNHVIQKHGPDMKLPCPYCKKPMKNKWALNAHVYRNHITLLDEYEKDHMA